MKRVLADGRWWRVFFWSGGLFFVGLLVTELFGEIPPDVDFKPFFLPLALAVALPARFGWAVGFGAAVGEGVGDLLEGYEVDDPVGFAGYVLAMAAAAHLVDGRPERRLRLLAAGLVAGAVNAVPEAFMMYLLDGVPALRAVLSAAGNTAVHGLLLGSLPLALLPVDWLHTFLSVFAGLDAPAANADERTTPTKGSTPRG